MNSKFYIPILLFASILFMSNRQGRGDKSGPATTAPGENGQFCGSSSCHSSGNFDPVLNLTLTDEDGNLVTEYQANTDYTVNLDISTSSTANGYGFQLVAIENINSSDVGIWSDLSTQMRNIELINRQYVEHNTRLSSNHIEFTWTSPDSGTGDITFYAAGIAADGDNRRDNDGAAITNSVFTESISSSTTGVENGLINIYPNPASSFIEVSEVRDVVLSVFDLEGQLLLQESTHRLNIQNLNSGIYILQVASLSGDILHTQKILTQ